MKKLTICIFTLLLLVCLPFGALAESYLVPGGQLLGITVEDGSFVIAGFDSRYGQAAKESGLQVGDKILKVNGKTLSDLKDLKQQVPLKQFASCLQSVCLQFYPK